jgi:hypothetical protein
VTTPLDDSIEKLQSLCAVLKNVNPALDGAAGDLSRVAHSLSDSEGRLSTGVDGLAGEVDGLQKAAQESEAVAGKAIEELGHAGQSTAAAALADLETAAGNAHSHWTEVLQSKSSSLTGELAALGSDFEPLRAALAHQKEDYERWTQGADGALGGLVQLFASLGGDVQHAIAQAAQEAHDVVGAPPFEQAFWNDADAAAHRVTEEIVPWFRKAALEAGQELIGIHETLVAEANEGGEHVRAQLDLTAQTAAEAVDAQVVEVSQALEDTMAAFSPAQVEIERTAIQADTVRGTSAGMVDLASRAATGEVRLLEIRAAMEALEP